jgi:hypothetical protein
MARIWLSYADFSVFVCAGSRPELFCCWCPLLHWEQESATAELFQLLHGNSPNRETGDYWIWMLDLARGYIVKSSYSLLQRDAQNAAANDDFSHPISRVWSSNVLSKVRAFVWKIFMTDYRRGLLWQEEACGIQEGKDAACFDSEMIKHHNTSFLSVIFNTEYGSVSLTGVACKGLCRKVVSCIFSNLGQ